MCGNIKEIYHRCKVFTFNCLKSGKKRIKWNWIWILILEKYMTLQKLSNQNINKLPTIYKNCDWFACSNTLILLQFKNQMPTAKNGYSENYSQSINNVSECNLITYFWEPLFNRNTRCISKIMLYPTLYLHVRRQQLGPYCG